jgi:prepilin-type N-terminal cleavage/methylation domain-containing protein
MKYYKKTKYEGFSLLEMLITISIMGVVMLLSSTVLTSLIKVSSVASNKIRARNESEFVLELLRRTVRNSDPSNVYIFDSISGGTGERKFNPEELTIEGTGELESIYSDILDENEKGNEIHFRPYGYRDWICLGFFKSDIESERGYILWTSAEDLAGNHESCFALEGPESYLMILNSKNINIKNFEISYIQSADGNYIIKFDILSEPLNWYLGPQSPINREILRQGIVSTGGISW